MSQHLSSHGRGGAGNMIDATKSPKLQPSDLETPTLKTPVVTTGRGGTGNMAKNTDPTETRLRQDIDGVLRQPSPGAQHAGRGGAGNFFKGGEQEKLQKTSGEAVSNDEASLEKGTEESLATKLKSGLFGKKT